MSTLQRIQRQRRSGWTKPPGAIYVGRGSKWGNPFPVGPDYTVDESIAAYESYLRDTEYGQKLVREARVELRGRVLMCWCKEGAPCHGDTLLRLANEEDL